MKGRERKYIANKKRRKNYFWFKGGKLKFKMNPRTLVIDFLMDAPYNQIEYKEITKESYNGKRLFLDTDEHAFFRD